MSNKLKKREVLKVLVKCQGEGKRSTLREVEAKSVFVGADSKTYEYKYLGQKHVLIVPNTLKEEIIAGVRVVGAVEGRVEAVSLFDDDAGDSSSGEGSVEIADMVLEHLTSNIVRSVSASAMDMKKWLIIGGVVLVVVFLVQRFIGG